MHQLDRIEEMLTLLTNGVPSNAIPRAEIKCGIDDMFRFMREGRKIEAIKVHRSLTGYGLKESKDEIERIMNRMMKEVA
jgi:ribosomal protein L7/L12